MTSEGFSKFARIGSGCRVPVTSTPMHEVNESIISPITPHMENFGYMSENIFESEENLRLVAISERSKETESPKTYSTLANIPSTCSGLGEISRKVDIVDSKVSKLLTCNCNIQLEQLNKNITTLTKEVLRLAKKVNNLTKDESSLFDLLPKFPLSDKMLLLEFEKRVQMDQNVADQLHSFFIKTGGIDAAKFLRTNLRNIITDEVATHFSWFGYHQNVKIKSFAIIKVVKDACSKKFQASDADMENVIKKFFNYAKDRVAKENKKTVSKRVNSEQE